MKKNFFTRRKINFTLNVLLFIIYNINTPPKKKKQHHNNMMCVEVFDDGICMLVVCWYINNSKALM